MKQTPLVMLLALGIVSVSGIAGISATLNVGFIDNNTCGFVDSTGTVVSKEAVSETNGGTFVCTAGADVANEDDFPKHIPPGDPNWTCTGPEDTYTNAIQVDTPKGLTLRCTNP